MAPALRKQAVHLLCVKAALSLRNLYVSLYSNFILADECPPFGTVHQNDFSVDLLLTEAASALEEPISPKYSSSVLHCVLKFIFQS